MIVLSSLKKKFEDQSRRAEYFLVVNNGRRDRGDSSLPGFLGQFLPVSGILDQPAERFYLSA